MTNTSETRPTTCPCGTVLIPGVSRALVLGPELAYCRRCVASWTPPIVTAVERRRGRNWPRASRCRVAS